MGLLSIFLLIGGGTLSLFCLWRLRRWFAEAQAANARHPGRMEILSESLVAAAEEAVAAVERKQAKLDQIVASLAARSDSLDAVISKAEARSAMLAALIAQSDRSLGVGSGTFAATTPTPDETRRAVCRLAEAGEPAGRIARRLSISQAEVGLVLGLWGPAHQERSS